MTSTGSVDACALNSKFSVIFERAHEKDGFTESGLLISFIEFRSDQLTTSAEYNSAIFGLWEPCS